MIRRLPAETVRFQLIVAGVEVDIFPIGIHQQIAVGGADGAVAEGHLVVLKRRNLVFEISDTSQRRQSMKSKNQPRGKTNKPSRCT